MGLKNKAITQKNEVIRSMPYAGNTIRHRKTDYLGAKKQIVEKFTDVAVDITRIPKADFVVFIQGYDDENCGVGGLTLDKVRKQSRSGAV